jgi:hypothetical protein
MHQTVSLCNSQRSRGGIRAVLQGREGKGDNSASERSTVTAPERGTVLGKAAQARHGLERLEAVLTAI